MSEGAGWAAPRGAPIGTWASGLVGQWASRRMAGGLGGVSPRGREGPGEACGDGKQRFAAISIVAATSASSASTGVRKPSSQVLEPCRPQWPRKDAEPVGACWFVPALSLMVAFRLERRDIHSRPANAHTNRLAHSPTCRLALLRTHQLANCNGRQVREAPGPSFLIHFRPDLSFTVVEYDRLPR